MMRSCLCYLVFMIAFSLGTKAQTNHIKDPAIGIHYIIDDFKTADYIRNYSLGEAFRNNRFARSSDLKSGLAISYMQGITPHFDLSATLTGAYLDYELHDGTVLGKGKLLLEADASLVGKIFTDRHLITPYLSGGLGASKYNDYYGIFIPLGLGLQMNFSDKVYLLISAQYRAGITNKVNNHFYYSFGIAGNIFRKKRVEPHQQKNTIVVQAVYDRDKDGIPDSLDICPDEPGLKELNGCPDRDGDRIADKDDKCPDVPGLARYQGCPIPDKDGDGINDEQDSCVSVPGVIEYHGCPVPDTDKDGINDEEDKCPLQPGPVANHGCPVVNDTIKKKVDLAAQKIFFRTGSYELLSKSFTSINDIAAVLKANPALHLLIEGHTDNVGTSQKNQLLSENRARAVKEYLVQKNGISKERLSTKGYGLSRPVATNTTAEGRALNRRVELTLFY